MGGRRRYSRLVNRLNLMFTPILTMLVLALIGHSRRPDSAENLCRQPLFWAFLVVLCTINMVYLQWASKSPQSDLSPHEKEFLTRTVGRGTALLSFVPLLVFRILAGIAQCAIAAIDVVSLHLGSLTDEWGKASRTPGDDEEPVTDRLGSSGVDTGKQGAGSAATRIDPESIFSQTPLDLRLLSGAISEKLAPGRSRWHFSAWAVAHVCAGIYIFVGALYGGMLEDVRTWILVGFTLLIAAVLRSLAAESWEEWKLTRDPFRSIAKELEAALKLVPNTYDETDRARELKTEFRHRRSKWLFAAFAGEIPMVIAFHWARAEGWFGDDAFHGKRLAAIVGTAVACAYWPACMICVLRYHRYVRNVTSGVRNRRVLELLLRCRIPFALYLRDFAREGDVADLVPRRFLLPPPSEIARREEGVIERIAQRLPVFCLTNYLDLNHAPTAARVNLVGTAWEPHFERLAARATLIVLSAERDSPGLRYELDWIDTNGAWSRTALILGDEISASLREQYPGSASSSTLEAAPPSGTKERLPPKLEEYLDSMVGSAKGGARGEECGIGAP